MFDQYHDRKEVLLYNLKALATWSPFPIILAIPISLPVGFALAWMLTFINRDRTYADNWQSWVTAVACLTGAGSYVSAAYQIALFIDHIGCDSPEEFATQVEWARTRLFENSWLLAVVYGVGAGIAASLWGKEGFAGLVALVLGLIVVFGTAFFCANPFGISGTLAAFGGGGGFGALCAAWLEEAGKGHVVLYGKYETEQLRRQTALHVPKPTPEPEAAVVREPAPLQSAPRPAAESALASWAREQAPAVEISEESVPQHPGPLTKVRRRD